MTKGSGSEEAILYLVKLILELEAGVYVLELILELDELSCIWWG
jgi:hypothetical protein